MVCTNWLLTEAHFCLILATTFDVGDNTQGRNNKIKI